MERRTEFLERRCLLSGTTGGLPSLAITKGLVASSNLNAIFDGPTGPSSVVFSHPKTDDHPFSGVISSEQIRTGTVPQPLDANLTNANAGDILRLAVLIENQSTSGTAFDVTFRDTLSAGVTYVSNSLQIVDGTGDAFPWQDLDGAMDGSGLFGSGIQLDDPGTTEGTFATPEHCGALDPLSATAPGRNIAVVFYDVMVLNPAGNTAAFTDSVSLIGYASSEGEQIWQHLCRMRQ